jgi:hypothetical protein
LALQVVAVTGVTQGVDTSTYSSQPVRRFVTEAAAINHRVPPKLGKYTAQLESEISFGNQNGAGTEIAVGIEQVASELTWNRLGEFEQHVVGYRQQSMGIQFASLGFFRNAWAIPSLYGNRLALLFGRDTSRRRVGGGNSDRRTTYAVHPLSDDREKFYRYTGGDTIQELKVGDRTIRIVRIDVVPRGVLPPRTVVFSGEMDLDADRRHIVRLRGAFAESGSESQGALGGLLKATKLEGIAYVELVNSEIEQEFWLPTYQRFHGPDHRRREGRFSHRIAVPRLSDRAPGGGEARGDGYTAGQTASAIDRAERYPWGVRSMAREHRKRHVGNARDGFRRCFPSALAGHRPSGDDGAG